MTDNSRLEPEDDAWKERARDLQENGGIHEQRAKVVALRERGYSYGEIAAILGLSSRGALHNQVREFRGAVDEAKWLAENAPEFGEELIEESDDDG